MSARALGWWGGGEWSERAAWGVAFVGLALFVVGIVRSNRSEARVLGFQQARNEVAERIRDAVMQGRRPEGPYFVYLRPFTVDKLFVYADFRTRAGGEYVEKYGVSTSRHDLESALALLLEGHGALVCLSDQPGLASAGHVKSSDEDWQGDVVKLCEAAAGIFIVPFDTPGTRWEVATIIERGWLDRTLFVMPVRTVLHKWLRVPWLSADYGGLWERARATYQASGLRLPAYDRRGAVVRMRAEAPEIVGWFADEKGESLVEELGPVLEELAARRQ